jgi:hypothetical protein
MRKLIESTLVSADGVVADPPLWAMEYRDEEVDADAWSGSRRATPC